MVDESYRNNLPLTELRFLMWFGVYCQLPPGGALWSPEETESLDAVEDDLIATIERWKPGWAVYPLRIATPGIREYYVYVNNVDAQEGLIRELRLKHPTYRIEMASKMDASWERYKTFLPKKPSK